MKLARYYKWNANKMQDRWFSLSEPKRDIIKKEIGMLFNTDLLKKFPGLKANLLKNNDGLCPVCYTELDAC